MVDGSGRVAQGVLAFPGQGILDLQQGVVNNEAPLETFHTAAQGLSGFARGRSGVQCTFRRPEHRCMTPPVTAVICDRSSTP